MPTLDADDLTRLVIDHGGPWAASRVRTITAVSVALAESGGRTGVKGGPNFDGTYDHGLWQINDVHARKFARRDIYDPRVNLDVAQQVWAEQGWGAWAAYPLRSGARRPEAIAAYNRAVQDAIDDPDRDVRIAEGELDRINEENLENVDTTAGLDDVAGGAIDVIEFLGDPSNWIRIGYVVLGGAAVITGLAIVASNSRTARNIASTAASVRGAK